MRSLWNKWRSTLNVKYVGNRSEEDAVKNLPPMWNKEDWEWCVKNVFMSEEYKKKSSTNKQNRRKHDDDEIPTVRHHNRSKPTRQIIYDMENQKNNKHNRSVQILNHGGGSRPYDRIKEQRQAKGLPISRGDVWIDANSNAYGSFRQPKAKAVAERIKELQDQGVKDDDIETDCLAQALGMKEHRSRVRTMGYGVTLSKLRKLATGQSSQSSRPSGSSTSRLSEAEYERLRAKMDERMHTEIERRMAEYKTQMDA